jgi:hypothetical protein
MLSQLISCRITTYQLTPPHFEWFSLVAEVILYWIHDSNEFEYRPHHCRSWILTPLRTQGPQPRGSDPKAPRLIRNEFTSLARAFAHHGGIIRGHILSRQLSVLDGWAPSSCFGRCYSPHFNSSEACNTEPDSRGQSTSHRMYQAIIDRSSEP